MLFTVRKGDGKGGMRMDKLTSGTTTHTLITEEN